MVISQQFDVNSKVFRGVTAPSGNGTIYFLGVMATLVAFFWYFKGCFKIIVYDISESLFFVFKFFDWRGVQIWLDNGFLDVLMESMLVFLLQLRASKSNTEAFLLAGSTTLFKSIYKHFMVVCFEVDYTFDYWLDSGAKIWVCWEYCLSSRIRKFYSILAVCGWLIMVLVRFLWALFIYG